MRTRETSCGRENRTPKPKRQSPMPNFRRVIRKAKFFLKTNDEHKVLKQGNIIFKTQVTSICTPLQISHDRGNRTPNHVLLSSTTYRWVICNC